MKSLKITLIVALIFASFSLTSCTEQSLNEDNVIENADDTDTPDNNPGGGIDD